MIVLLIILHTQLAAFGFHRYIIKTVFVVAANQCGRCNAGAATVGFVFYTTLVGAHFYFVAVIQLLHKVYIDAFFFKSRTITYIAAFLVHIHFHNVIAQQNIVWRPSVYNIICPSRFYIFYVVHFERYTAIFFHRGFVLTIYG